MCLHDAERAAKVSSHKMAPGENFGGDKLTSWVMGIPQCEKLSHIHGWTYEPFGEPQENECTILPRIPLISSGDQAGAFFVLSVYLSLSLSVYIYIHIYMLSLVRAPLTEGPRGCQRIWRNPVPIHSNHWLPRDLPLLFSDVFCHCTAWIKAAAAQRWAPEGFDDPWSCCLYGHSAFQWPFLFNGNSRILKWRYVSTI